MKSILIFSLFSFDGKILYSSKKSFSAWFFTNQKNHSCHRNCKNWSQSWHNNRAMENVFRFRFLCWRYFYEFNQGIYKFPNLRKNIITIGIIIVFNNLFRVWKVIAFIAIAPALHTGYINSKQTLLKTLGASLCCKATEFLWSHILDSLEGLLVNVLSIPEIPFLVFLSWHKPL